MEKEFLEEWRMCSLLYEWSKRMKEKSQTDLKIEIGRATNGWDQHLVNWWISMRQERCKPEVWAELFFSCCRERHPMRSSTLLFITNF